MPSGPKKRKAARRKKEKENNNININHSSKTDNPLQGNDDLKSRDEKWSDARETNSLAYRKHGGHHDPLKDGSEVIRERDPPAAQPIASDGENGRLEHVETAKQSCYKSGNCGGNSNDESLAEKNSKDAIYNSVKTVASVSEVEKCDTGVEHTKDFETPKCSKNQPSASSVPNSVQKTSWWSCCGLLEVLSGSKR